MTKVKIDAPTIAVALISSLVLVLLIIIAAFIFYNASLREQPPGKTPAAPVASNPFPDCSPLAKSCNDSKCDYYSLCAVAPDFKNCQVYDCGKNYGIAVTTKENKTLTKTYPKPDVAEAQKNISACQGTVKIISDKCEKNIEKITAEVATQGDCPLAALLFKTSDQWQPASFAALANNQYSFSIPTCGNIQELKAIGAGGTTIGSAISPKQ